MKIKAGFKFLAFSKAVRNFTARVKPGKNGFSLNIHVEQPWGPKLGSLAIPGNESRDWVALNCEVGSTDGVQVLWLNFYGEGDGMFELDWVRFE
jgi:hypothetical protein